MIRELAATVFYLGYVPVAPGTFGSMAPVIFVLLLLLVGISPIIAGGIALGLAAVLLFIGVRLGSWAEQQWHHKDPSSFVLDEVVGCFLSMGPLLIIFPQLNFFWLVILPFFFFRIFDVRKPFPVHRVEHVKGGWGIMLDDLVAAVYALAASVAVILTISEQYVTRT